MRRVLPLIILAIGLLFPALATARSAEERAAAFTESDAAIKAKDWTRAYAILNELWTEQPAFDVATTLGQVELNMKFWVAAAEHLAYGLRNFPVLEKPAKRQRIADLLATAKEHVATLDISVSAAGATVFVEGKRVGTSPLTREAYVLPGLRIISAEHPEFKPVQSELAVSAGQSYPVELKFTEAATEVPPPAAAPPGTESVPSTAPTDNGTVRRRGWSTKKTVVVIAGAGLTALLAGAGTVFALKAKAAKDEATELSGALGGNSLCVDSPNTERCSALRNARDDYDSSLTWTNVFFVSAGVFGAATLATVVLWPSEPSTIGVSVGPNKIMMSGRF